MKRITLFILLISLLLPMSLSAQSVKAGAQKIKANVAKIEAGAVKGDRSKADNRLATRANGISPKSASVEVGSRSVNRVRRAPENGVMTWDFEDASQFNDWTTLDNDGDGFNWEYFNNTGLTTDRMTAHEGEGLVASASYDKESGSALYPDNWLISPEVTLGGALTLWACGQDESYASEVFGVYVCVSDPSNINNYLQVGSNVTATGEYVKYKFDLSAYAGQTGHFAIRHYNVSDMFWLNIDDVTLDLNLLPDPTVPTNLTVAPGATTADVTWEDTDDEAWNLRWRPWTDLSGNPHSWDFALDTYESQMEDWWIYDADEDGYSWGLAYSSDALDDACLYSYSWSSGSGGLTPDNYVGTPDVPLKGVLRFTVWGASDDYPDVFQVYAKVVDEEFEDMHPLFDTDLSTTEKHQTYEVDLSAFEGAEGCIIFRHYNCKDQMRIYIDDVYVGDPDAVIDPAEWIYVNGLDDTEYTIEGLVPETDYVVQVQACNEQEESNWSEETIFTTVECEMPTNLAVSDIKTRSAQISWEGTNDSYNLRYRTAASTPIFTENWESGLGSWVGNNLNDDSGLSEYFGYGNSIGYVLNSNNNPPQYLISPELDGVTEGMMLEFYYSASQGDFNPETFQVGYSSTNTDISAFTFGDEILVDDTQWHIYSETVPVGTKYFSVKYNSKNQALLLVDNFIVKSEVETPAGEWITIEGIEDTKYEITGLEPNTKYEVQVQGVCDETETPWSETEPTIFTTLIPAECEMPTNLAVSDIEPRSAQVSWEGTNDGYNLRYREVDLSNLAMVTLTADDVWGDGSGYQMLLDADATAYGTIIPETGGLTSSGNADASVYGAFEYKIPTNADGVLTTSNILNNKSMTIFIPAGTYDWCITNPTPGDRVWIASANGNVSGRQDDYEFEANKVYEFHVSLGGSNDRVDVTITDVVGSGDSDATAWTTKNDVDSPYNLTALSPETLYEVQVQGDCGDGQSEWISKYFVTLPACPTPSNVTVEPGVATANVTWEGYSDSYNLRYRTARTPIFAENWENGEINSWTGYNLHDNSGLAYDSENQDNICFGFYYTENPPQYLISPKLSGVKAGMKLEFRYMVRSSNYPESFQVGYSSTTNDVSAFTWGEEITTNNTTYQLFSETIPAGTKYFCVQCTSDDQYYLYVDDFVVASEAGEWTTIEGIEDTEYELTGLEPDTRYEVQVQGVCDETETAWSEIELFATLEALVLLNDDLAEEVQNSDKLTEAVSASGTLVNVMLKDRTFFKDGNWNTLCLPFSVSEDEIANSPLAGANIKKFYDGNVTGTHVDIVFTDATDIEAGEYYIFKWDEGEDISNPAFKNVEIVLNDSYHYDYRDGNYFKVYGNFSSFEVDPTLDGCYTYYLSSDGNLKYSDKYRVLKTFRIFFRFTADNDAAGALDFNLVFDDGSTQTGIVELDGNGRDNRAPEGYYNLQGVKYNGKPIQKGVYINNGRKVVVK